MQLLSKKDKMALRLVNYRLWIQMDQLDDTFKNWSIVATEDNLEAFSDQVQTIKGIINKARGI